MLWREDAPPMKPKSDASATNSWRENPFQTIERTSELLCVSRGKVHELLNNGRLRAVRVEGSIKVMVETATIEDVLATAKPWKANRTIIDIANAARAEKRAERAREVERTGVQN
jgi:hypothetical protein